jgi:peroxiredoxin (alkyl hydroperoxide reductase subunit C)
MQVWCVAPNDHFVMHAWGHELGAHGKVRMMGDGSHLCAAALGLQWDLTAKGMGMRCHRALLLLRNGVVVHAAQEEPGKFEVSSAGAALQALSKL